MEIKPTLLVVTGLPQCGKSDHLKKALEACKVTSDEEAMMPLSNLSNQRGGIPYSELSAVISPNDQFPVYFETSKETTYLYAIDAILRLKYLLQQKYISNYKLPKKDVIPEDQELNNHFRIIIESLQESCNVKRRFKYKWQQKIQTSLTLINVWDIIGLNKAAFHFLPALWGNLERSFMWLFFDVDRDLHELGEYRKLSSTEFSESDLSHVMPYRTRLRYLFREAMLARTNIKGKPNCSIFGIKTNKAIDSANLSDLMMNGAISMGVDDIIKEIVPFQKDKESAYATLKEKMDEIASRGQEKREKIPLNFIFLRSMYHYLDGMFVSREDMKAKAKHLNISDSQMDEFFKLFSSSGSIIDLGLDFVIMKPMAFIKKLDDLFIPKDELDSPQLKEYGLLTTETAEVIFGKKDFSFYLKILTSVNLALKIEEDRLYRDNECKKCYDVLYYIPDVRTACPDLTNYPNSLLLRMSINSSLCHMQVLFAKEFLAMNKNCLLCLENSCPVNLTKFQIDDTVLCLQYLGEVIEFRTENPTKKIALAIVNACNKVMGTDEKTKYNFAIKCSEVGEFKGVDRLAQPHHVLPYKSERCKGEVDNKWKDKVEVKIQYYMQLICFLF